MSAREADSRLARRGRRARRLLRAAAVAFVTAYAVYLVALNVFLSTSLFDRVINLDPVTIDIHYRRGWSWIPGRIHAEKLSIRSSDSNVEWVLSLDEVDFDLSVIGVFHRRFHVTRARGHGIALRARQKLSIPPQSTKDFANLPPIEGFPAFSMRPAGPPSLERWFDEHYSLWTVRLDDVVAEDVREVWVDDGRFQGSARVTGGFYLKPIRDVRVGPCHVDFAPDGRVTLGPATLLAQAALGTADLAISPFDPRTIEGSNIFRYITLRTELAARFADPATLPVHLPFSLSTEIAARLVRLDIENGVLRRGTRVELDSPHVKVTKSKLVGRGELGFVAEVTQDDQGDRLRTELDLRRISVATGATKIARADRLSITTNARALDLANTPLRDAVTVLDLPVAEIDDARALNAFIPKHGPLRITSGKARTGGRVELSHAEKEASGSGYVSSSKTCIVAGGTSAAAALDGHVRFHGLRKDTERLVLDRATLSLRDVIIDREDKTPAHASIASVVLNAKTPAFAFADPLERLELDLALASGPIADGAALAAVLPGRVAVRFAKGGSVDIHGRLSVDRHVARGHAQAAAKLVTFHGKRFALAGDTEVDADLTRWDLDDNAIDLGLSHVSLDEVRGRIGDRVTTNVTARRIVLVGKGSNLSEPSLRNIDARLVLDNAVLEDARALQFLVPGPDALRIGSGSARAFGSVAISSKAEAAGGVLEVDIDHGTLAIHETVLAGDFAFRALLHGFDPKTSTLHLSGSTLAMRNVQVEGAAAETRRWRGDAVLDEATLQLDGPKSETPRLDGIVRIEADDARPLLGVLLRDSLPKIVVGLVTMPRLTGYARVHLSPNLFLLSDVTASGGDVAVRGSYGRFGQDRLGAFIVEKGPFSVGIGLDQRGARPRFFNLDAWLGAHRFRAKAKAAEELKGDDDGQKVGK